MRAFEFKRIINNLIKGKYFSAECKRDSAKMCKFIGHRLFFGPNFFFFLEILFLFDKTFLENVFQLSDLQINMIRVGGCLKNFNYFNFSLRLLSIRPLLF